MTSRRCIAMMLAASVFFVLTAAQASAFGKRTIIPPVYNVYPYGYVYPQFNPYVAPLPAYGIMPLPLATYGMLGYDIYDRGGDAGSTNMLDYEPRKRPSIYPAVPYDPAPQAGDRNRARFEITVPTADAVVLFDGAKTKQTGLTRSFVTPALGADRLYSATVEVRWRDEAGTQVTRRRVFEFVAGETVTHRFSE